MQLQCRTGWFSGPRRTPYLSDNAKYPERGVFARTSLQSDVCCLYDSTALKELVSRRLPHPMSREAITGAHIVPQEQCHFDQEKGAFIHSASESR
ncbi:T3SS effector NleG family protein [Salmonella enterica]|uniref:T3SS effector NleG family protein n=1 Tax=Salmonella enterica TaxID=28901 RepID=UPI00118560D0